MNDLKQLALEWADRWIGSINERAWSDTSRRSDGFRDGLQRALAVAMLRFAAKVKCEACIHQAADELEGKP